MPPSPELILSEVQDLREELRETRKEIAELKDMLGTISFNWLALHQRVVTNEMQQAPFRAPMPSLTQEEKKAYYQTQTESMRTVAKSTKTTTIFAGIGTAVATCILVLMNSGSCHAPANQAQAAPHTEIVK